MRKKVRRMWKGNARMARMNLSGRERDARLVCDEVLGCTKGQSTALVIAENAHPSVPIRSSSKETVLFCVVDLESLHVGRCRFRGT